MDPGRGRTINFTENIKLRFVYGHTEAMMLPQINYKGRTVVFMADLLPSMAHVPIPYVMAYDVRPLSTLIEKTNFLAEASQENYILFFEHDPSFECCDTTRIRKRNQAFPSLPPG